MTVESQLCPQCGSAIQFAKGKTKAVCAYCGTTVVKSKAPTAGAIPLKKEIEAEKLGQEVIDRGIRLHSEGRPATAKILSVQKTDIFRSMLNGKGMLMSFAVEVLPDNEAPFNTETKTFVGLPALDKYQLGTVLDVRYDPKDHTQVSVEGRHGVPGSNPWQPDEQERKAEEMIRKGDEMIRKADEEYKRGEEEYRQGEEEYNSSDTENDGSVKARKQPKKT